jgi:hypothetical protein
MPYKDPRKKRAYAKKYGKEWYQRNKQRVIDGNARRRAVLLQRWREFKESKACVVCGAKHPAIIDFHHVIRKNKRSITRLVSDGRIKAAMNEAETKCVPLCANCHRIHHYNERHKLPAEPRIKPKE